MQILGAIGLAGISQIALGAIVLDVLAAPCTDMALPCANHLANHLDIPASLQTSPTLKNGKPRFPMLLLILKLTPLSRHASVSATKSFGDRATTPTGWQIGIEDLRLGQTRATLSTGYSQNSTGSDRDLYADLNYSLMPLGQNFQIAPTIGYRRLTVNHLATSGLELGWRTRLILSRRSAADITLDQTWVAPGTDQETGRTKLSLGYAITKNVRIATD
ncbi:MAG: hypothetical protein HC795_18650, partial [Coleofasciculaceae cyanobacterium RL_1_1]|nr:hypothetical protein [Coleofasciculaceae cyanobacterium RL_1_1]